MKLNYFFAVLLLLAGTCKLYAQAPKITSFSPANGAAGTLVTISGSGFSGVADSNVVYFGTTHAKINTANDTQLQVTVPSGAAYSRLVVINKTTHLSAVSVLAFSPDLALDSTAVVGPKVRLRSTAQVADVQLMDIDGDGKPDIVATSPVLHKLMVFLNKSTKGSIDTGSFAAPVVYSTGPQPGIVSIYDMDGDGKPDIVLMNAGYSATANGNNSLTLFQNLSTPGKIKLSAVAIVDSAANVSPSYNFQLKPGDNVTRIGDFDGDGKPDIAVLNTAGSIAIYRNTYIPGLPLKSIFGPVVSIPVAPHPITFTIGDMDNDGKLDMITTNPGSNLISVFLNHSTPGNISPGSFQETDIPLTDQPITSGIADVDGDGIPDVVINTAFGSPTVLIHNTSAAGHFETTNISIASLNISSNYNDNLLLQDINGDGKPDLISLSHGLDSVYLYTNKSTMGQVKSAYFNNKINLPVVTAPDCLGDLDGDGKPDIVIGSAFGIDIYHNSTAIAPPPPPVVIAQNKGEMTVYPNPAAPVTNVKYYLPANSVVQISIFDMSGRLWGSFKTTQQTAGMNISTIQTSNLRIGTYVVEVMATGYKKAAKLIVQ